MPTPHPDLKQALEALEEVIPPHRHREVVEHRMTDLIQAAEKAREALELVLEYRILCPMGVTGKLIDALSALSEAVEREPKPLVTEFNVGRWCMSEDDCIAAGINFAAYERGVSDAAKAFGQNMEGEDPRRTLDEERAKALAWVPPEPWAYVYEWDNHPFGLHRSFSPAPYNGNKPDRAVAVYTGEPVAQAVRRAREQERESCAAQVPTSWLDPLMGELSKEFGSPPYNRQATEFLCRKIAAAIRNRKTT